MTEYLIATSVLEGIVRWSLAGDERVRLHSALPLVRTHPAEVLVDDESCKVVVHLDARMGELLPDLAATVRTKIAAALGPMTGLVVTGVDVVFSGVFPAGS
jgi:uncharacterized alkaline shock family protein YloU